MLIKKTCIILYEWKNYYIFITKRCVGKEAAVHAPMQTPMGRHISYLNEQQNTKMRKLFITAYTVAKHNLAFRTFSTLCMMQQQNGLELGKTYHNHVAATEFIDCIATMFQQSIAQKLNTSTFFSILIDGSTDRSVEEQEIVYVRLMENNRPVNRFFGLIQVPDSSAKGIVQSLEEHFLKRGIDEWKRKVIGFGADGASVNMGCRGGIVAILRVEIPHLVEVHCVAHRLELSVLDACKEVSYVQIFEKIVKGVLKFYSHSSKRNRELHEIADTLEAATLKYGSWNPIRWIACKTRTLVAVDKNWHSTVTHLEHTATSSTGDDGSKAKGLLKALTTLKFVRFLAFMLDFTASLSKLSVAYQSDFVTLPEVIDQLESTQAEIGLLPKSSGPSMSRFDTEIKKHEYYEFRGVRLNGSEADESSYLANIKSLASKSVHYLSDRFQLSDSDILNNMEIFDSRNWPKEREELILYGKQQLDSIVINFESVLGVDVAEKAKEQWMALKLLIAKRFAHMKFFNLWEKLLEEQTLKFPDILKVVEIILLLPMNTAACERGFSKMNIIKSDYRTQLQSVSLNNLMYLSIDGPSVQEFDPQPAIDYWASKSLRVRRPDYVRNN